MSLNLRIAKQGGGRGADPCLPALAAPQPRDRAAASRPLALSLKCHPARLAQEIAGKPKALPISFIQGFGFI